MGKRNAAPGAAKAPPKTAMPGAFKLAAGAPRRPVRDVAPPPDFSIDDIFGGTTKRTAPSADAPATKRTKTAAASAPASASPPPRPSSGSASQVGSSSKTTAAGRKTDKTSITAKTGGPIMLPKKAVEEVTFAVSSTGVVQKPGAQATSGGAAAAGETAPVLTAADLDLFDSRGDKSRKRTDDGLRIFSLDELGVGGGKDTPDCPFDCQCCF
ncbi:hypothetical protein CXG81DRAFT_26414 [Caulochytrium protostelioides]|uniref:DUF1764-domain-containing protein n=1 Tax=Caulochytrium protostelioides TaxID=1555241 RepID=A0A4P9X6R7_9FUNG|nr:hypothetical protein CXG81DRAFT_26414 [Caulochytrium protostelioides]|eukprot:RKP00875.1 hypothetical protein CXG81DRAFT_26414 [Caulochytrium protostelioides]